MRLTLKMKSLCPILVQIMEQECIVPKVNERILSNETGTASDPSSYNKQGLTVETYFVLIARETLNTRSIMFWFYLPSDSN